MQHVGDLAEEGADADVDAERQARHLSPLAERHRLRRKERGQVVDAEEAEVFQRVQGLRLSGARQAADDDHRGPDG